MKDQKVTWLADWSKREFPDIEPAVLLRAHKIVEGVNRNPRKQEDLSTTVKK